MTLFDNIKVLRAQKGWTQADLARFASVSVETIKRYENGKTNPTNDNLSKIANALGIDIKNLYDSVSPSMSPSGKNLSLSPKNLSPSPPNLKPQNDMIRIPLLHHINASAGSGAINELPKEIEHRGFTKEILRESFGVVGDYQNLFIIHSFGNSMHPTIPQNALLLVQKGIPLEGQICVARIGEEMFVKRIAKLPKIRLLSDNERYDPINITDEMDFEIIGRVVGYFGRL